MSQIAENQESLLESSKDEPTQLSLLDCAPDQVEALTKGKAGQFTGELLFKREPEKYQAVVAAIAGGLSIRGVARALKLSPGTIRAVKAREGMAIGAHKKGIAATFRTFVAMAAERMVEEVDEIPIDRLMLAAGIATDKMQLLEGEATQIVEHDHKVSFDDYNALLDRIGSPSDTGTTPEEKSAIAAAGSDLVTVDAELLEDTTDQGAEAARLVSNHGTSPDQ